MERENNMKLHVRCSLLLTFIVLSLVGCAHMAGDLSPIYAPAESSLTNLNQKVTSHFLAGIPDGFGNNEYIEAVNEVCRDNPACLSQLKDILDRYSLNVRKIGEMFSVMLCDKERKYKVLEDYSCNNMQVEEQTWKIGRNESCTFQENWQSVQQRYCAE